MTPRAAWWLLGLGLLPWHGVAAQRQGVAARWSLQLLGPAVPTLADLRFDPGGARILTEAADSAWRPLEALDTTAGRLDFTLDGRQFRGERTAEGAAGTVRSDDGRTVAWRATPIQPGLVAWPVRPRITVRQLVVGSPAQAGGFSDRWLAARPTATTLETEYREALMALGWMPTGPEAIGGRTEALSLGFDPAGRAAARALLARIAASPAADDAFRRLFTGPGGGVRLDLHDVAWEGARRRVPALATDPAAVARGLVALGSLPGGAIGAPEALVRAGWQAWVEVSRQPESRDARLAALAATDADAARAVGALLEGYDEGRAWWVGAVRWLMTSRWVETPTGLASPADLLATFWGGDVGPLPALVPTAYGMAQAVPVLGANRLAPWLLRPANAIAPEWLATRTAAIEAITLWRGLEAGAPLEVVLPDGGRAVVTSPAELVRGRYGSFLAADDAIQAEPGILPLFAVTTVVHEWLHLLLERERLAGVAPPGLRESAWGVRLLEPDPWLGEGFAEWGTDAVLAPARTMTPLFAVLEAGKRLGLAVRRPDDTHVLGHALVRALATRLGDGAAVRALLIRALHDPAEVARVAGIDGPITRTMPRPATLAILPETAFTPDDGVADDPVRRLHLPVRPEDLP